MFDTIFITLSQYGDALFRALLIGLGILLIIMAFSGLFWYFRKIWSARDDDSTRSQVNSTIKWMVFSWIGLLTIEIILLIVYTSIS